VHAKGRAAARVGVPDELGEQAHRCARSGGAVSGTDEPAQRARLADMARLSVAHDDVEALTVRDLALGAQGSAGRSASNSTSGPRR